MDIIQVINFLKKNGVKSLEFKDDGTIYITETHGSISIFDIESNEIHPFVIVGGKINTFEGISQ